MIALAESLYQLRGFPPNAINVYLMDDVLVDAGTRFDRRRILKQLRGREVKAHALTHAHPDHQGASHAVCTELGAPFWCGELDADAAEDPREILARMKPHPLTTWLAPLIMGPGHPVARRLREGDRVGSFTVIETPGHCAGHLSYWRERDKVLVLGDVAANIDPLLGLTGLHEPPAFFSADVARNRESARRAAALGAELVCFGHGPPLRDPERFRAFAERLAGR